MAKTIAVFTHDANPAIDAPSFYVSRADAQERAAAGRYRVFTAVGDDTLIVALQLLPPLKSFNEVAAHGASFRDAWHPAPSAGVMVWQMRARK